MYRKSAGRAWRRWILGLLMAGTLAATVFAGKDQAFGGPGASAASPLDVVVLTGSYSCNVYSYYYPPPPPPVPAPTPDPVSSPAPEPMTDEPVPVRELIHYVSISGTGAVTMPPATPTPVPQAPTIGPGIGPGFGPGIGPGFAGRAVLGGLVPAPVSLGSGVSAAFDGGTAEDCVRFGQAVAAVAHSLGCVTSPLRTRQGIPIVTAEARFSFVCEGPAAVEIHTIGELDRAVLTQRPSL